MKRGKKLLSPLQIWLVIFLLIEILPIPRAYADVCQPTDLGCLPRTPLGFAQKMYSIGLGLVGGVGLLFIIYGGYLVMTSRGNPSQLGKGKSYIGYALAGILLAILGYVFIGVLTGDILHLPGFSA